MKPDPDKLALSRRRFLTASCGFAAMAGAGLCAHATPAAVKAIKDANENNNQTTEPFWGEHQSGILTPSQCHTYFSAFDIVTNDRDNVIKMLQRWTSAAARMARGQTAEPLADDAGVPAADSGDALGLPASRLTVTFGFGAGMFIKDGQDRFHLAARRPAALVELPKFTGDQLLDTRTGGDISIQACADDPQVAFHAVRQLARLAYDVAQIRWVQTGYAAAPNKETPRNLMGFKDGTNNPLASDAQAIEKHLWVGDEGPDWMRGGSYLVARRIRIALEHWDRMTLAFQEQTVGRKKYSGAPLGESHELDGADYDATDKDGNPIIPENAHMRLASAANNDGAQILRRGYSYNDGANITAERWPPWRQEMEYDAGLFFLCYQSDPRTGFIKIFDKMSKFDMMNQFVTHTGGGLFACPGGITQGGYIGQRLFEKA
jgi:deferrochelatase/peroxidase EfeB